ncbi:hypothetical protein M422DRAFT_33619 [Sphaerobolus stellatus SS14]|uniref:Enhancer of mRNA-decapping protein 4 n=1 Tax=Sphaerobolus stellatus (strain SS14) TaxID=990650 RepID=A0A0C9VJB9_SPHS4|nr:hypothetical protein M422DRAFT_33619 [Sphaerobolus stellatus SS14]
MHPSSSNYSPQGPSEPTLRNPSPQGNNEMTGKQLLDQLMAGQADSASVYSHNTYQGSTTDLAQSPYASSDTLSNPQWPSLAQPQPTPPSPTRKSMFDFVSPFDALNAAPPQSGPSASRKKPVPPINQGSSSNEESSSISEERRGRDAKHQSMENLLSEASKGFPPLPSPPQLTPMRQEYMSNDPYGPAPPPPPELRPKPGGPRTNDSPHVSPKTRPRAANMDVNISSSSLHTPQSQGGQRGRDSSPTPRRRGGPKKIVPPAGPPPKSIIFDVSRPLDSIHAANSVKSTAIALVKIEPTFLPGSTIGAASWIAYAMTKGRVRVISRSSGDRTLLQLPGWFSPAATVIDMVVSGNRLAGVTSDGGFVVWELPKLIEDDVPASLLMSVQPSQGNGAIKTVKWHPRQPDTLAVASENRIHLLNVDEIHRMYITESISPSEFLKIGQSFQVASPIVGFAFDIPHVAIATISEDSMLTLWNIRDRLPFWNNKIFGEGTPSSIDFLDGGIVIGRKNGTIFQLLSVMGREVLSTVKFVNGDREDPDMFGHVAYDSRIQTLWVANSRRESLIAIKVGFEPATPSPTGEEMYRGGFEQIVEFSGPKASIHFVILTPETDPSGEEAHAACVAAKLPPGELALVAFNAHSAGVDQVEENLHNKIGRLIAKELDKQHVRLEEIRQAEQHKEMDRQQTILKLISTELTKNTTRVVEGAIKNEVQQSVLPALERITKDEVKMAVNGQISKGLTDSIHQTLPLEIERLLLRPDVANHVARTFSASVTPLVEKHVMDVISNTLIPAYKQISTGMHQELSREIRSEIISLKKEIVTWQSEALRGQEALIRDMEHSIRMLSDQVKMLTLNAPLGAMQPRGTASPGSSTGTGSHGHGGIPAHLRQAPHTMGSHPQYAPPSGSYGPQQAPPPGQNWYSSGSLPTQATPPSNVSNVNMTSQSSKTEEWEEVFMTVLGSQDLRQLRELLARSNPEVILPSSGKTPLSQAVVLTLIHRLASIVSDANPADESYKSSLWWLQRAATALNPSDGLISPYIARLLPNIQNTLTAARQRLILPGMPPQHADNSRVIHDIQEILSRKPLPAAH